MKSKYIFIGAGFANLSAINYLLDNEINDIVLFEKGKTISERNCPGIDDSECVKCNTCDVVCGFGGSNALFGNKLCYFPASSDILKYFHQDAIISSFDYMSNKLGLYFDENKIKTLDNDPNKKHYFSEPFKKKEFSELVNLLKYDITNSDIDIIHKEVKDIKKTKSDMFCLTTKNGDVYKSKNAIIGTGRSGNKFLETSLKNFNIPYLDNKPDVGIRIEMNKSNYNQNYLYQVDPKFKFKVPELGIARTFCAHNQGTITPVKFGKAFYADGAFLNNFSNTNNIALMSRINTPYNKLKLENWCYDINKYFNNSLLIKTLNLNTINLDELPNIITGSIPYWPNRKYRKLINFLSSKMFKDDRYKIIKNNLKGKLRIYGPAIDKYWIKPEIKSNLSTRVNNLYIIGDAAGISRGFIQSMFSGVAWASQKIKYNNKSNKYNNINLTKEKEIWSVSE